MSGSLRWLCLVCSNLLMVCISLGQAIPWRLASGTEGFYSAAIDVYRKDPDTLYSIGFVQPTSISALYQSRMSTDKGEHWDSICAPGIGADYGAIKIDPTDSRTIYVSTANFLGGNSVGMTTDGGLSWQGIARGRSNPSPVITIDPMNSNLVYVAVGPGTVHRTTDDGQSWTLLANMTTGYVMALDIARPNDSLLYEAGGAGFFKSNDCGLSRIALETPGDSLWGWRQISVDPTDAQIVYATYNSLDDSLNIAGVFKSTDGGANWAQKNNGLDELNRAIDCIAINPKFPNEIFLGLGGTTLVFHSTDGGENWLPFANGLPGQGHVQAITVDTLNDRIYVGVVAGPTSQVPGSGIYINTLSPTAVFMPTRNQFPSEVRLYPNYPNPFNPATTISFELPRTSDIRLSIYDALGREIKRMLDQKLNAGAHQIQWNGTNQNGIDVSGGIYFYRLEMQDATHLARNLTQVKKMVLIR